MIIKIADLARCPRRFDFNLDAGAVKNAIGNRPGLGSGIGTRVGVLCELCDRTVNLSGRIRVEFHAVCDRCAEEFDAAIDLAWKVVLSPRSRRPGPEIEDVGFGYYSRDRIDLGRRALNFVGLMFPEVLLCSPDCKGICPDCGVNLNREKCRCPKADAG